MNPERWGRVKDVFSRAVERPAAEREAWVEQACADDAAVRAEVSRLIAAHEEAGSFIEQPAADLHIGQQREPRAEMAGRILQQYRLESLVGVGGMGKVYRATDLELGRTVAITLVDHDDQKAHERLRREARHASRMPGWSPSSWCSRSPACGAGRATRCRRRRRPCAPSRYCPSGTCQAMPRRTTSPMRSRKH